MTAAISADERLRAATAALAEHEQLTHARALLAEDVAAEEQRVQALTVALARERADVQALTQGVLGFIYSLAITDEVSREQREAAEAEVRLREAIASRDALRAQLQSLDVRLGQRTRAQLEAEVQASRAARDAEVQASRSAREAALLGGYTPVSAELQDLAIRIESIDLELVPLEDAVTAGNAAAARLAEILAALDRTAPGVVDHARAPAQDTRGLAGDAQARVTLFHRAVDALAVPDDASPPFSAAIAFEDRQPFVDAWLRGLFGPGEPGARLAAARETIGARLGRVQDQLAPVRARRDELAARRAALVARRDQLIDAR